MLIFVSSAICSSEIPLRERCWPSGGRGVGIGEVDFCAAIDSLSRLHCRSNLQHIHNT